MSDYKLVPVEPTAEMLAAGKHALEAGCYASGIYADMLAAAPAVQGEAVAWQLRTQDERLLRSAANSLRGYALELMLSHTLENGEWPDGEEDAKAHHDHMRALAKGLEELQAARTEAVQGEPGDSAEGDSK